MRLELTSPLIAVIWDSEKSFKIKQKCKTSKQSD